MNFEAIKPEFLKKIDHHLLLHYPALWHSKIIWVACYAITAFTGVYLFGDFFDTEMIYEYKDYATEGNDMPIFYGLFSVLTSLMVIYWLYLQYQQKIDYSKFSTAKFFGIISLNYASIILFFVPILGVIHGGVLDVSRNQEYAWIAWQSVLYGAMPLSVLPLIIRHFTLIEMVLTVFFGVVYCLLIALFTSLLNGFSGGGFLKEIPVIYLLNYLIIGGMVLVKFKAGTYTQNTKRLGLLLILSFPLIVPTLLFVIGDLMEFRTSYTIREDNGIYILYFIAGLMLVAYSIFARYMYRRMMFPVKRG